MNKIKLQSACCAICRTEGNARELYPANFDQRAFNPEIFSARRLPDKIHYRLVKCNICGLVRSDPIADTNVLDQLYAQSSFNYDEEVVNLRITYGAYLSKLDKIGVEKGSLLEIGCGNGFFLEEALSQGYCSVKGVEPSLGAIEKAVPQVRNHIVKDIMRAGLFVANQFNVICMFQVLDHIHDPVDVLKECFRLLKPQGVILCINHNIEAVSARLLKSKSPVIDIEHTYLYSPGTMKRLFSLCQFKVKAVGPVWNRYSLFYLTRLLPLPLKFKCRALDFLKNKPAARISMNFPLGNFFLVAQKPARTK